MKPDFEKRKEAWIAKSLSAAGTGPFSELIRLHRKQLVEIEPLEKMLLKINSRKDCADFQVAGFIRMVYLYSDSPHLPDSMKEKIKRTLLDFKYWPDEPGIDDMCSWSENHHILFASAGYLAGQKYADEVFTNSGRTGREMAERFLPRVKKWLEMRFATGFSEWLSNVYYNEDFPALFNLLDFSEDADIKNRASMIIDLLLTDIALNSHEGMFASTHGRSYEKDKKYAGHEGTAPITALLFGGEVFKPGNFSAISLILSSYEMPPIIKEMAHHHLKGAEETRQISGFDLMDGKALGLDRKNIDDGMAFLTSEAYMHPRFVSTFMKMLDAYNWWDNKFFKDFKPFRNLLRFLKTTGLLIPFFKLLEKDTNRNYRSPAHIYTYRTPDYMMSSARNYRPGFGGDQQSPWQVTLGGSATCFVTHPGRVRQLEETGATPRYWTGYGTLPAVAQYRNCSIMIFKTNTAPGLYLTNRQLMTHAWLPVKEFDEFIEEGHWYFASKGKSYLALWSRNEAHWCEEEEEKTDLIASGKDNVWICQAGSEEENGSFAEFRLSILRSDLQAGKNKVSFDSPGNGHLEFSWKGSLFLDGKEVDMVNKHRYENSFGKVSYPSDQIEFSSETSTLKLDWVTGQRSFT